MYKLPMYRDGALPALHQRFHQGEIHLLRSSFWVIQLWNHSNLASPYWRLYWNAESGAEVRLGERVFPLTPDALLLIAPSTPYTTRFSGAGTEIPEDNVMLGCPADQWQPDPAAGERVVHHFFTHFLLGTPYDCMAPQIFAVALDAQMREVTRALSASIASDPHTLTQQQSFSLHALIYFALAQVPDHLWPAPQTDERMVAVLRHIDAHYPERLTNADFAQLVAMTPKSFVRLFRAKMEMTPLDYLRRQRLEHASILLHHTDDSIEAIAERCGFFDRYHFSKLFQRAFGVGPATYRKTRLP